MTAYDSLFKYIETHSQTQLTKSEMEMIKNAFVLKKLRKRQYLLQEGEICKYFSFIVKGAMRQYSVDDKGVEHIVQLSVENWCRRSREFYNAYTFYL